MPFSRVLYIEQEDFREVPPPKYFRLSPGVEVRLRYAYFVKCVGVVKDPKTGEVAELRCTYDPATRGGDSPDGRKVKATLHWVSAAHALEAEVRLYDPLFTQENPDDVPEGADWKASINPNSLEVLTGCRVEPSLKGAAPGGAVPVRAARLLLRGPGFRERRPGLQPHRDAQGRMGADREGREEGAIALTRSPASGPRLRPASGVEWTWIEKARSSRTS